MRRPRGLPGNFFRTMSEPTFDSCPDCCVSPSHLVFLRNEKMKRQQSNRPMRNQMNALLAGVILCLGSAGTTHAMSSLISLSTEPVWPASSTPDGNLVYNVTTVARAGSGLLEVVLTAGDMPAGVTVTFSPATLRFTGNQLISQTATM